MARKLWEEIYARSFLIVPGFDDLPSCRMAIKGQALQGGFEE